MKKNIVCILFLFVNIVRAFDPFSTTIVVGTAATSALVMLGEYVGLTNVRCNIGLIECCGDVYIRPNMTGLNRDLKTFLYGQHLVEDTVYKAVKGHLQDDKPQKPLVMSFHGWTGGGKNYVTRMIIKNIYVKAEKSSFVHIFNAEVDFKHKNQVPLYKDQLQSWLHGNVSRCEKSIFIFDEMDHMPEGLIDALKPYLGTQPSIHRVDYRKCIFIFLSNTGGNVIVKKCIDVWQEGQPRNSIMLAHMQGLLEGCAYNQKSGLRLSGIIDRNLIDHFVPFLPLERDHVRMCIQDEIKRKRPHLKIHQMTAIVDDVLEELQWFPKDNRLYSKSGCKKISQKVALILNNY